jgi:hypothetical protein
MTKWADPVENPKQNEQYWKERKRRELIFCLSIAIGYAIFVAAIIYHWLP